MFTAVLVTISKTWKQPKCPSAGEWIRKMWYRCREDGRGIRCGDHLLPHRYIKNTSTCGTTTTEQLLNDGRRPQTSNKARKSLHKWVGQKKKGKKRDKGIGMAPSPLGGSCEGGKVSTHYEAPSLAGTEGSFRASEENAATGV